MIGDELKKQIADNLGHSPTAEQANAIGVFCRFLTDYEPHCPPVMILRGSAGTGKTTVAAAIVRGLLALKQKLVLMAPTGRAAKVFSLYAGQPAYTIHRRIYRQRTAGDLSAFSLNDNLHTDTLFIVDEASMIASSSDDSPFGSGNLLDDLVHYVYSGRNCRLMLIGDQAQLPPVGQEASPALHAGVLRGYGLQVCEATLREVLRQSRQSGILFNATRIRELAGHPSQRDSSIAGHASQRDSNIEQRQIVLPQVRFAGFTDITLVPGDELIEQLSSSYSHAGTDETIVVTRSNKRANVYNQGIRRTVLDREEELCRGDQLMIVKNNYYWCEKGKVNSLDYLANGDRCVVQRVRNVHEMHGFRFADVTLLFPDYDDTELTATVVLDTLTSEAPALTREQQEQLYNKVMEDYADIPLKTDRLKALRQDRYYNALQVKFGYAVTCHKAQGGQWAHVYVDQGYMTDDMLTPDYIHWLYTAFTRATEHLFLVNWPARQSEQGGEEPGQ